MLVENVWFTVFIEVHPQSLSLCLVQIFVGLYSSCYVHWGTVMLG